MEGIDNEVQRQIKRADRGKRGSKGNQNWAKVEQDSDEIELPAVKRKRADI